MLHCIIGLRILNQLVEEINRRSERRTVTEHRRIAVSFRDLNLLYIFELSLSVLNQVATRSLGLGSMSQQEAVAIEDKILSQALSLASECLSFDFIGTNPDESSEDVGTIQVPSTWRDKFQSPDHLCMLFSLYHGAATGSIRLRGAAGGQGATASMLQSTGRAAQVLEVLTLFVSARRSMFSSDSARKSFLLLAMSGVVDVLKERVGLGDSSCYHRFCQLLGRLKANYQLTELVRTDVYPQWLELTANFTKESLGNLHALSNSIHYLLTLWSRMVSAVPFVRGDGPTSANAAASGRSSTLLAQYAPEVLNAYLEARLQLAQMVATGESDNADLDEQEMAVMQVEQLPGLFRFQYDVSCRTLGGALDTLLQRHESLADVVGNAVLQQGASAVNGGDANATAAKRSLGVVEAQLAWLVYIVGAIIGDAPFGSSSHGDGDEKRDAQLCRRVIMLIMSIDRRLTRTQGVVKCDYRLEMAALYFLGSFRKTYFVESRGMPSPPPAIGGTSNQPLLDDSAAAAAAGGSSSGGGGGTDSSLRSGVLASRASRVTQKARQFNAMFEEMGLGDHLVVASNFIKKLANNLANWPASETVLTSTLDVFQEMTHSYSSGKLLLALDIVHSLLLHHTEEHYKFLSPPENGRLRTRFYMCVARLLYISEDPDVMFEKFMSPIAAAMDTAQSAMGVKSEAVAAKVAGVCRDLRGIIAAAHNPRTYQLVFEVLYPKYFDMLVSVAGAWADVPFVTTPLLKMLAELVHNRAHRISFGASSPNGILLFRQISRVPVAYGSALASAAIPSDDSKWTSRYKGMSVLFTILARILDGSYVNYGVFELYADSSLSSALETALQLALSIPDADLQAYPKLCRAFYFFMHVMSKNHLKSLVGIPPQHWQHIMKCMREGLEVTDQTVVNHASYAVDAIATAFVQHARKDDETGTKLRAQVAGDPAVFDELMKLLFQLLMFGEASTQWALSRPMLPLILAADIVQPQTWEAFKGSLVASQPEADGVRAQLVEELGKLMKDITRSLDSPNRDRFSQHLSNFRLTVRTFIKM